MKMKRLTLTLLLLVAIAINALSSDIITVDGIKYLVNTENNTATVVKNKYSGNIVIPPTVTYEGKEFPITTIGKEAFASSDVSSISFGKNVTTLEDGCFQHSKLEKLTYLAQFSNVGKECFKECYSLYNLTIEEGVKSIPDYCFSRCVKLKFDKLPQSLTRIGFCAFEECNLKNVVLPNSITKLDNGCFMRNESLENINIPSSINVIPSGFVRDCTSLESIEIPSSVDSIMGVAFSGTPIKEISIPASVKVVGNQVFCDCNNLLRIYCYAQVPPRIGGNWTMFPIFDQFDNKGICTLYVPKESINAYKNDEQWGVIENIKSIESGNITEITQCSTPTISYNDGKLSFECNTTGAEYHYSIVDADVATDKYNSNGKVQLNGELDISVYATADGCKASDRANATIYWLDGEETTDNINLAKNKRGVMVSTNNGITISGLSDGEVITIYSVDGKNLGSTKAIQGTAHFNTPIQSLVILKINGKEIKISTL